MPMHAWKRRLREGKEAEYERRHASVWPELEAALRDAGVTGYAIFRDGRTLIGCFEPVGGADWGIAERLKPVWTLGD